MNKVCATLFTTLVFLLSTNASAVYVDTRLTYYPSDFYDRLEEGMDGEDIKTELHEILNGLHQISEDEEGHDRIVEDCDWSSDCYEHESVGYDQARRLLFGDLHLERTSNGDYRILDVYCEEFYEDDDFPNGEGPGPGQIPDNDILNTEHSWPQGRFSNDYPDSIQKSDLHILFPVSMRTNSTRNSLEYGDVITATATPCEQAKRGYSAFGGTTQFFEMAHSHKGNAARAVFYFSIRYELPISAREEYALRDWHMWDPVDDFEIERAERIFEEQKVRNPFIDHPELVDEIADF